MKLLTFLAKHFSWQAHSRTLESEPETSVSDRMEETVVVFLQSAAQDEAEGERARVFKHTLKHVKWLAGKRSFKRVVLHSFTHLGAQNATPEFAKAFIEDLAARLESTGYEVKCTPFGYFCEWELAVYGESLAKVWKEV